VRVTRATLMVAIVGTVAGSLLFTSAASANDSGSCDMSGWACDIENSGTQLDIGGSYTEPGSGAENVGWSPGGGGLPGPPPRPTPGERGSPDCAPDATVCVPVYEEAVPAEEAEDDVIPEVTLADLASFAPARPDLAAEPAAAGIVGMPTNFVAAAQQQTLAGTLFDRPVTVRFTPVAYVFDRGDGSSGRAVDGGASWDALGQPQFSATPTSHAYAERGTYVAGVTVEYAPEVDFGAGWTPVAGVVTATTGGYDVEIYEVRTGLVDRTCVENPTGPGC
jgi:hypothetical protein